MTPLASEIWNSKYRWSAESFTAETEIDHTWRRVADAVAVAEEDREHWAGEFLSILQDFRFLPGGRILAGAGTERQVTLLNCFVSGPIEDSMTGILDALKETAITMQQGGGIGVDFSSLRPSGSRAMRTGAIASGPVTFMHTWDALCETLLSTSTRRGAMMGTLRCDHPDIESFIDAKRGCDSLTNFNLSVLVTDKFMQAVEGDLDWPLIYPPVDGGAVSLSGSTVFTQLSARRLWRRFCEAAAEASEPGLLFIDRINRENNLGYCESISATNPCGEIPLPPYGACDLGSINLTKFVCAPFSPQAGLDMEAICDVARIAVRFLDDVIDISAFPLKQQAEQARLGRRLGLGITGLADALTMLGVHYDSDRGRALAAEAMTAIRDTAYATSASLARCKGAFPAFDADKFLSAPFIQRLPEKLRDTIRRHGIRNSHLLAIAPAGTISLLAGNVSSGIEPIFALEATRTVRDRELIERQHEARDYAFELWSAQHAGEEEPDYFVTAPALTASAHLGMQACLQPLVDNAISKTLNLPPHADADDIADVYRNAWELGIKGCTVFRPGTCAGQVISECGS